MLPPSPPKNYKISSAFSYNFRLALTAYKYFGGVTRIIQCDNLKTGVQKHGKDEAVLNKSHQDLALLIKHTATYKELKPLYSEYKKTVTRKSICADMSVRSFSLKRRRGR